MSEYENIIKNYPLDVNKYLDETKGHFINQEMIKIVEMKNSYFDAAIVNGMLQACVSYNIYVDEEKLRKWVNMCMSLDHIPYKEHKNLAINAKIRRLEARVAELEAENQNLKEHIEWQERILENERGF